MSSLLHPKPRGVFIMDAQNRDFVYGPPEHAALAELLDLEPFVVSKDNLAEVLPRLGEVEIALASWGVPLLDDTFLAASPKLRALFYAAGSIRKFVTPAVWARPITFSSAYAANAIPVAEYTLGTILLSLKKFWSYQRVGKQPLPWGDHTRHVPGAFRSTVGLVSAGMIGRRVIELLRPFDFHVLLYDPFVTPDEAQKLGVDLVSLRQIFQRSDVVSIHTPLLDSTREFINGELLALMKHDATLINSARGGLIRDADLFSVFAARPDLTAVIDVTEPEPPAIGSPFYTLDNIVITPHIAGSHGPECQRLGAYMVEELRRYLKGEPLRWAITPENFERLA